MDGEGVLVHDEHMKSRKTRMHENALGLNHMNLDTNWPRSII